MKLHRVLLGCVGLTVIIGLLQVAGSWAAGDTASAPRLVLKGHDPVAYFTAGKPVKGSENLGYVWDGGRYWFANEKNRAQFVSAPDRYAPQFAGFCTGGMSINEKIEADPMQWKIVEGKLYVFSSPSFRKRAPPELAGTIVLAEKHWPKLK